MYIIILIMASENSETLPENGWIQDSKELNLSAPSYEHQELSGLICSQFLRYLSGKSCKVIQDVDVSLFEPYEEYLHKKKTIRNYQGRFKRPDILVLCDISKRKDGKIFGAPDLIIEISSPSTASEDFIEKRELYQKAGVREYWIVMDSEVVYKYILTDGVYQEKKPVEGEPVPVDIFPDLHITLKEE